MKKITIFLTILIAIAITALTNHRVQAQWATQNSTTTDTLSSVFFVDANIGYVNGAIQDFGEFNHILLKTINGGSTWTNLNFNNVGFSIYFTDASTGYMAGIDTIFKTINGGANWTKYPLGLGTVIIMDIYFFNASVGYATAWDYNSNTTYMLHTTDAGASWISVAGGVAGGQLNGLFCTSATTCYAVGWNGSGHGVYKTTDGGNVWTFLSDPSGDCGSIYFTSATNGVVVGGHYIYQTTDGGNSWNPVYNNSTNGPATVCFADANNGFAVGKSGTIVNTTDGGATWNPMSSPTTNDLSNVNFPTATTGYAVGNTGTIIKFTGLVGIEDNNYHSAISIFPNPASDIVTLNINRKSNEAFTLNIYNVIGTLVKSATMKQNQQQINIGDLCNGIYMVTIKSKNLTENQKLIIQR